MLCVGCRDVPLSLFFIFVSFCPFVLLSARTKPLYNYRNFNFLLLLWTEKIFMAMNKHWQLFINFPPLFLFQYSVGVCLKSAGFNGALYSKI